MKFTGEHIWIIGASSGIGEALAKELDAQGATLILSARTEESLNQLNDSLGGKHKVMPLDVGDNDAVEQAAATIRKDIARLDRVIFLAAIYKPANINARDVEFSRNLVTVNLLGALYVTYAVLPIFDAQKTGQMVLCGSVAGYTGLPGGQPYSATKAAIANFTESLYAEVEDYIDVKLISPGFVRTRITDKNDFPMPMRIEPEQAAKAIAKGLRGRAFEIHFPKAFTLAVKFLRLLPYSIALWATRKMRGKSG
jgi:short-subunit dehydrogenase